eukprot:jgi/Chrzof1/5080/Cz15g10300.t1
MANGDSGIVVEAVGSDSAWSVGTSSRSAVQQRALSDDGHTWGSGVSVDSAAIGNRLTPALPNWTNTGEFKDITPFKQYTSNMMLQVQAYNQHANEKIATVINPIDKHISSVW